MNEEQILNPPNRYRPVPQWSLNGDLTERRIVEQLESFKTQGCGGLFPHPRPGHITGYLTDRWFQLWDFAAAECERLGMDYHIYDEFMCPGGAAGGQVVAEDPTVIAQTLVLKHVGDTRPGERLLHVKIAERDVRAVAREDATHVLVLERSANGPGGLPAPDLLRRETVETFIQTTHERYRETSGRHFGKTTTMVFCDEPHIQVARDGLPFSRHLMKEFRKDHGYSLEGEELLKLCFERDGSPGVRFDYWRTVNRLFNENFMRPLYEWCDANGLLLTGHLMENEWPSPLSTPDNMAALRWMHVPGEDLLAFQFSPTDVRTNGLYILNLKELSSLVNQLGCEQSMVETTGARGYHTAFEYFKPCEDLTLSFGVNVIDPHLSHESLAGCSKYDWPQTLSDHSPWWRHYHVHADHVTRVNAALGQGREVNRVLVLMPTTTAWSQSTGKAFDEATGGDCTRRLEEIKASQIDLVCTLYEAQVDFDLGDEFVIEEFGSVRESKFVVGERAYDVVVLPPALENLNASTFRLLCEYVQEGGEVLSLRAGLRMLDGRPSDELGTLKSAASWRAVESTDEVVSAIRAKCPPYCSSPSGEPLPGGVAWRRAVTGDGTVVWFFANPWGRAVQTAVRIRGAGAVCFDTLEGTSQPAAFKREEDHVIVPLELQPRGHMLLAVSDGETAPAAPDSREWQSISLSPVSAARVNPNLLYVDYCDVEAYGLKRTDVNTALADTANWRWQGFDENPWGKQFKRTLVDREPDPDSEVRVTYRFTVNNVPQGETWICIERPGFYELTLNGRPIDQSSGSRWFDEDMMQFPVAEFVCEGENTLTLHARPFTTLCEIMPLYVRGEFDAVPAEKGFAIAAPAELTRGDWTQQGAPFYPDVVRYAYGFDLEEAVPGLKATLPRWEGQAAEVFVDGDSYGPVLHPPFECEMTRPFEKGRHQLVVEIIGNMKNMMGSHHHEGHPLRWTFEYTPDHMPAGAQYKLLPTGLIEDPVLERVV